MPMPHASSLVLAVALAACAGPAATGPSEPTGLGAGQGQVIGVVRDAVSGAPLGFAHVRALEGDAERGDDLTDADGRFAIALPPGGYRIAARYGSTGAEVPDVIVLEGRAIELAIELEASARRALPTADGVAIAAPARGVITGVVYDGASGERFVGAVIAATAPSLPDAMMAMTDERGQYRFIGLPPDTYQLSVYYHLIDRGNLELRRGGVTVRPAQTTTVDLAIDLRVQR